MCWNVNITPSEVCSITTAFTGKVLVMACFFCAFLYSWSLSADTEDSLSGVTVTCHFKSHQQSSGDKEERNLLCWWRYTLNNMGSVHLCSSLPRERKQNVTGTLWLVLPGGYLRASQWYTCRKPHQKGKVVLFLTYLSASIVLNGVAVIWNTTIYMAQVITTCSEWNMTSWCKYNNTTEIMMLFIHLIKHDNYNNVAFIYENDCIRLIFSSGQKLQHWQLVWIYTWTQLVSWTTKHLS